MNRLAQRLRERARELGSVKNLADELKFCPRSVGAWCRGEWTPGQMACRVIAFKLSMTRDEVDDLMFEDATVPAPKRGQVGGWCRGAINPLRLSQIGKAGAMARHSVRAGVGQEALPWGSR